MMILSDFGCLALQHPHKSFPGLKGGLEKTVRLTKMGKSHLTFHSDSGDFLKFIELTGERGKIEFAVKRHQMQVFLTVIVVKMDHRQTL